MAKDQREEMLKTALDPGSTYRNILGRDSMAHVVPLAIKSGKTDPEATYMANVIQDPINDVITRLALVSDK